MTNNKMNALAKVFVEEVKVVKVDDITFQVNDEEFNVFTQDERDEAVSDVIEETLWAFNASFLAEMTDIEEEVFEKLAELCESANGAVKAIIENTCGLEKFVDEAIQSDGYGHFLSRYDGYQMELEGELYAYRIE